MKLNTLAPLLAGLAATMLLPASALADYITLPVKWSQPIGFTNGPTIIGADRFSDHSDPISPRVMADDFLCTDPNPVTAVRWWGSYVGVSTPRTNSVGFSVPFDISFHLSTTNAHPNSKPGTLLLFEQVVAQEVFVGYDQTGDAVYRTATMLTCRWSLTK